jgi:hypothetical protein
MILSKKQIKISIVLLLLMLIITACERARFEPVDYQCTIQNNEILCPDGTSAPLPQDGDPGIPGRDGTDGINGIDGADGKDGTTIDVVDPCGDDPNHPDEVILLMGRDLYLAWYKNVGFSVLEESVAYQTTDKQKCNFSIVNGEVVSL